MRYRFGAFEADIAAKELRKGGVPLKLGEQPFKVLSALLERPGEEVRREDLQQRIWPNGTYVDFDKGLNSAVNKLRDALTDSADRPRYIETVPRRGYRFIAPLETVVPKPGAYTPDDLRADSEATLGTVEVAPLQGQNATTNRSGIFGLGTTRRLLIAAVIAIVGLTGAVMLTLYRRQPGPVAIRSLLILPFQSPNSADSDYLGQGISEQVTARLAALSGLRLISSAAAHRIGSLEVSPQEAGRRLDVEAVLFGSVRRTEHKIRVNAQMIRSSDGQVLWAEGGLAVEGRDLLEAESLVATTIVSRLRRSLTLSEQGAISRRLSPNAEAYEFFVRGKLALRKSNPSGDELLVAEKLLQQATALDPDFAEAFAWHAIAQYAKFSVGIAGDEAKKASLENAWKALALDPTVTAARRALIGIFHSTGQAEEGLKQASILRRSGATDSDSLTAMAQAYLRAGMPDRSIPLYQRALELDPQDESLPGYLGFAANWARQYDLGLHVLQANPSRFAFDRMLNARGAGQHDVARSAALETMREAGPFGFAICWLTLKELGGMEEAHRLWRSRSAAFERDSVRLRNERVRIGLGIMYAALGERRKAVDQLRLTLETNPGDPWSLFWAAEAYGLLDDHQKARESLQQAVNKGFLSLFYLDHQFERPPRGLYRFRDDPRFRTIRDQLATKIKRLRDQY